MGWDDVLKKMMVLLYSTKEQQQVQTLFQRLFRFDLFFLLVVFDGEYIYIYVISLPLGLQVIMFKQHL